jgi:hypothetical protein
MGVKWNKRTASAVLERRAYMKRTFKPIREASFGYSEEFPAATHLDLMGSSSSARSTTQWWRPFFYSIPLKYGTSPNIHKNLSLVAARNKSFFLETAPTLPR